MRELYLLGVMTGNWKVEMVEKDQRGHSVPSFNPANDFSGFHTALA